MSNSSESALAHELVSQVKELALELQRTPNASEFQARVPGGKYRFLKAFGSFSALLQAAGLETYDERRGKKKVDRSVFERSLERHLESLEPAAVLERKPYPKIAVISDIHWPFACQRVIDAFLAFIERERPEWVILNGDAWDMYSHARFPRSHNVFIPREERRIAREANDKFWIEVRRRCPGAQLVQMLGNHDVRPLRQSLERYPEAEDWIAEGLRREFTFDGVRTVFDAREELIIGDIMIHHGYRTKLGDHRDYSLYNAVIGHTHKGGSVFRRIRGQTLWELNSGFAGDPEGKGLTYTPQKITDWTPGFGYVDEDGPRFIPA